MRLPRLQRSDSQTPGNVLKAVLSLRQQNLVPTLFQTGNRKTGHMRDDISSSFFKFQANGRLWNLPTHLFLCFLLSSLVSLFLKVWRNAVVDVECDHDSVKKDRSARVSAADWNERILRALRSYFSPAIFLVSLASVPFISSSHPPDIFGRLLVFWSFFSSLISSDKKSPNALSPVEKGGYRV